MRLAAILVAALAIGACGHGSTAPKATAPVASDDVVTAARGVLEQWRQAYEVRSADALAKLYAHDPALVVVQEGRALVGWPAVEAVIEDRLSRHQKVVIRLRDITVAALGPTAATATATMTRELGDDVTTLTENGTITMALRHDGEHWVIVAEHYSYRKGS